MNRRPDIMAGLDGIKAAVSIAALIGETVPLGRDGTAMKDDAGKIKHRPIIEFTSKAVRDRFSDAVIEALKVAHPEAIP
jgi:hypothetical protein